MKQPLVIVAVLYGAGIVLGHYLEASLPVTFAVAFLVTVTAVFVAKVRPLLLPATVLLFGWLNVSSRTAVLSPFDLRSISPGGDSLVSIRARIVETPAERIAIHDGVESSRTLTELSVLAVREAHGEWQPAHGRVMSRTRGVLPRDFVKGQEVEVRGILAEPPTRLAAGTFDYREHLRSTLIYHEFKIESVDAWKLASAKQQAPVAERFREWAQRILARGLPEHDEPLRLQWAMLLGWKTALTAEVSEPFMRSGTMHIFAISGLHIALIAGIGVAVLRACGLSRVACGLIVVPVIWSYTAATGWQASAIRATVMMSVIICGWALRRPSDLVNSLATAACLILLWQPEQLFQPGFQLSFSVVLSIALLGPPIDHWKGRIFGPDPMLPDELRSRSQRIALRAGNAAWSSCAISLAAFIGSMPLLAHYFHLFTPGSIVANLVIVPISSLALMSGMGSLVTGDVVPVLTELFNHSGWFWMRWMIWLSELASAVPGAWCHVASPSLRFMALYYGLALAACAGWFSRPRLRWALSGAAGMLLIWSGCEMWMERKWHVITVLPFNNAHVLFVEPAQGGPEWLINVGDESAAEFVVKPFLQAQGVDRIPHLILTHGEARFVSGAPLVNSLFPIEQTLVSPLRFRSSRYQDSLRTLNGRTKVKHHLTNGFVAPPWTVLHPAGFENARAAREGPVVALGIFDEVSVLFVPPIANAAQNAIFTRNPNLRVDIVIAALAADVEPAFEWIASLRPKLLLLAESGAPPTRQRALQQRLNQLCPALLVTTDTGAVSLQVRQNRWQVRMARATGPGQGPEKDVPDAQGE